VLDLGVTPEVDVNLEPRMTY